MKRMSVIDRMFSNAENWAASVLPPDLFLWVGGCGMGKKYYLCGMKSFDKIALDFEIDCLTNSIRNVISGDSFPTDVMRLTTADLPQVAKKNKWLFVWKSTNGNQYHCSE
ncbi:hypothetical protein AGMMS4956_14330 [Bacteroidia bacterium]|nr:hypothetical protein AGMMS4956_14330 [Bacteroidia bacterium]